MGTDMGYIAYIETVGYLQAVWLRPMGGLQPKCEEMPDFYVQEEEGWNFRLVEDRRDLEQLLWDRYGGYEEVPPITQIVWIGGRP